MIIKVIRNLGSYIILVVVTFLLTTTITVYGQKNKFELLKLIANNSVDTIKLRAYISLADAKLFTIPDSAYSYYISASKIAHKSRTEDLLGEDSVARLNIKIDRCIGICHAITGNNDSAFYYYNRSLNLSRQMRDTVEMIKNINNIAVQLNNFGQYDKAISYYHEGLMLSEKINNTLLIANFCNNISVFYNSDERFRDHDKALFYIKKSLQCSLQINDEHLIANSYVNIATLFQNNNADSLRYYAYKAIPIYEKLNDYRSLSVCYYNIGLRYLSDSMLTESLTNLVKAKKLAVKSGDKKKISVANATISGLYYQIAKKNTGVLRQEYIKIAKENALEGLEIAQELGSLPDIVASSRALVDVFELLGNYKEANFYMKMEQKATDSISNNELVEATYRIENKFMLERNDLLEKDKKISEKLAQHRKTIIWLVLIGIFALTISLVFLFLRMRLVKKQNVVIKEQKRTVDSQNAILTQKNEEILSQKEEIETQRDFVCKQREEIISSINYARRIQEAVLPKLASLSGSNFVLFLPKDIVSGDFYWFSQSGNKLMIAVADCTGHGVPGAFMSMLGLSYMREMVGFYNNSTPAQMLDIIRQMIIEALNQNGTPFEQRDGMDMSICVLDTETYELQFSAAYNSMFVVPRNGEAYSIKGDFQPVAFHYRMLPFTNHVIQMELGDTFYLMSDGAKDQINYQGKRFSYKRLTEMLVSMQCYSMEVQKKKLSEALFEWRGDEKQTDDITLLGYRI